MSGKGSRPRPFSVSDEEYANRWDAIFGRDQPEIKEDAVPHCEARPESCPVCLKEQEEKK